MGSPFKQNESFFFKILFWIINLCRDKRILGFLSLISLGSQNHATYIKMKKGRLFVYKRIDSLLSTL